MSNDQSGIITHKLDPESMEEILLNCTELKEANFKNQIKDVDFFVNNLTPKIEKLNISYNDDFLSKHVVQLVKRCYSISELDLKDCRLYIDGYDFDGEPNENENYLLAIFENLSQSLIKLQLGRHGILIFSCLLFVLFEKICSIKSCHFANHGILIEKTKPDGFLTFP